VGIVEQLDLSGFKVNRRESGKKAGGKPPGSPAEEVPGKMRYNFTDSESRIMKGRTGKQFEQAYNARIAVDVESMLIVGEYVTNRCHDKEELAEVVKSIDGEIYEAKKLAADSGYDREEGVKEAEGRDEEGNEVYCAVGRQSHHLRVADLEAKEEGGVEAGASAKVSPIP
jgi:hypothetical protein